jgi:undecaprenyl-diphosphatase
MTFLVTLILSFIQGVTEFLPVSSSGHLFLVSHFLPYSDPNLFFDVILHLGTLLAVIVFFLPRWKQLIPRPNFLINLTVCTLPAVIIGLIAKDFIENFLRSPTIVVAALISGALILWLADRHNRLLSSTLTWQKALVIGLFQALAFIPGASRAGMTISGGLFMGLKRKESTEFSFLAAIPVIAGAGTLEIFQAISQASSINWCQAALGFVLSFFFGLMSIKWLIKFLQTRGFKTFVGYRILLGLIILVLLV